MKKELPPAHEPKATKDGESRSQNFERYYNLYFPQVLPAMERIAGEAGWDYCSAYFSELTILYLQGKVRLPKRSKLFAQAKAYATNKQLEKKKCRSTSHIAACYRDTIYDISSSLLDCICEDEPVEAVITSPGIFLAPKTHLLRNVCA